MIASGIAARTIPRRPSRSKTSPTTASAPAAAIAAVRDCTRVSPTTAWPAATSCGTSRRPTAPLAPATKTLMLSRDLNQRFVQMSALAVRALPGLDQLRFVKHEPAAAAPRRLDHNPPAARTGGLQEMTHVIFGVRPRDAELVRNRGNR